MVKGNVDVEADIRFGDGVVTIRRKNQAATVCVLLGVVRLDRQADGSGSDSGRGDGSDERQVYLDRRIHEDHERSLGGYPVDGPVVSVLTVPAQVLKAVQGGLPG